MDREAWDPAIHGGHKELDTAEQLNNNNKHISTVHFDSFNISSVAQSPTISSSVVPFSSCLQSFSASGSFQMNQFFASGGQSIGVSFSFSINPSNECSGLISLRIDWLDVLVVHGTLEFSPTRQFKRMNSSLLSFLYSATAKSIHDSWKNHSFD